VDELQWDAECLVLMYYQYLYLGTDKDDLLDCPDSGNEANYIIYIMHLFFSFFYFIHIYIDDYGEVLSGHLFNLSFI